MRILLTNDDGVHAHGIRALHGVLSRIAEVHVVVPARECSAGGHGVSMVTPLRVRRVTLAAGFSAHAVEGTPADCVKLALGEILKRPPDVVVSGINHGANIGMNVFYSGTVSAAMEGAMAGFPAFAVSAAMRSGREPDFASIGQRFVPLMKEILPANAGARRVYSVNFPAIPAKKAKAPRWATLTLQPTHRELFERRCDPDGQPYYWNAGIFRFPSKGNTTDAALLARGHITITPLAIDLTDHRFLNGGNHGKKA